MKDICGMTEARVREAYFDGKLPVLFASIMSGARPSDADIKKLGATLESFRQEEVAFAEKLREDYKGAIPGAEPKPPSVGELYAGTSDKEWRENADKAMAYIDNILDEIRHRVAKKEKFEAHFWLDKAAIVLSYKGLLDRDRVYKDQLYRARMTEIIDTYSISRKEAEERARITPEYAEYKNATLLDERIIEFVNLCKKKDAENSRPY